MIESVLPNHPLRGLSAAEQLRKVLPCTNVLGQRGRSAMLRAEGLWGYRDVGMLGYGEEGMWGCADAGMLGCGQEEMWGCRDVGMWGHGDVGIWGRKDAGM